MEPTEEVEEVSDRAKLIYKGMAIAFGYVGFLYSLKTIGDLKDKVKSLEYRLSYLERVKTSEPFKPPPLEVIVVGYENKKKESDEAS